MAIRVVETATQYSTIQGAIDALLNGTGLTANRTIEIDSGTYYENLSMTGTTHKTNTFTLTIKNATGQTVTLNGNGTANANVYMLNMSNLIFDGINMENCNPEDAGGANVRILGTTGTWGLADNITIKNCTIRIGYAAVRCTDYARNITFQNVTTSNCRYGTFRFGKQTVDLQNVNFINCNISTDGLQNSGANQFQLKGINGLNIIRCYLDGAEKLILSPWYCDNVLIDGCIFTRAGLLSTTGRHIYLEDNCDNWIIQNCLFINCTRNAPIYTNNSTEITFRNNTVVDESTSKTEYFYHNNINGLYMYNNIFVIHGSATIGFHRFASSTSNIIGTKFISRNNVYHFRNGSQRNIYNGTTGGTTLPSGGVTAARGVNLEQSSVQGISAGNYVSFTDMVNGVYTLQSDSPARNTALMSQVPAKDIRNYTRDSSTSDIGAYDMDGIAPILPTSILNISVDGQIKNEPFGILQNTQVTFNNLSINALTTTLEIFNSSNTVIGSSSSFPYTFTFVNLGVYRIRMISTNIDGSDILDLTNRITVDNLPIPSFNIATLPTILNGESATFNISDSSTGGTTILGGITSKLWQLLNQNNEIIYQSNSTPFVINASQITQGTYHTRLNVTNIVGTASMNIDNSILINRTPTLNYSIPLQIGTRLNPFTYTLPNNIFNDGTDTITYSITSKPNWLSYEPTTKVLSGTPDSTGLYTVIVRGTDSRGLYLETTFGVNIGSGNPPAVIRQPVNKGIPVGTQFVYKILPSIFYSPDNFTMTVITKPVWLDYDVSTSTLVGEPTISDIGIHTVVIRADDGFTQADCTFTIEVFNYNQITTINNGDSNSGIRTKLNNLINFINKIR